MFTVHDLSGWIPQLVDHQHWLISWRKIPNFRLWIQKQSRKFSVSIFSKVSFPFIWSGDLFHPGNCLLNKLYLKLFNSAGLPKAISVSVTVCYGSSWHESDRIALPEPLHMVPEITAHAMACNQSLQVMHRIISMDQDYRLTITRAIN